jgi:D12 class N6 adenine-specific DNA methyltransferase
MKSQDRTEQYQLNLGRELVDCQPPEIPRDGLPLRGQKCGTIRALADARARSSPTQQIPVPEHCESPQREDNFTGTRLPARVAKYPEFRYMGSKHRLLPWIHDVLRTIDFHTAADPFVGSGCVSYLMKAMGKRVIASDFLNFPTVMPKRLSRTRSIVSKAL